MVPFTVVAAWMVVATIRAAVALGSVRADTTSLSLENWQYPQRHGAQEAGRLLGTTAASAIGGKEAAAASEATFHWPSVGRRK